MDSPHLVTGTTQHPVIGRITLACSPRGLVTISVQPPGEPPSAEGKDRASARGDNDVRPSSREVALLLDALDDYLAGERRTLPERVDWESLEDFQRLVLQAVAAIPYGQTRSYGEIARLIGKPGAARAVGRANATNPMPIFIPCHRVVGGDGSLRDYSMPGGVAVKAWLLRLEGALLL